MKRKPGSFNFYKEQPQESGCRACKYNVCGVCSKVDKEVPITSATANRTPKWCPKKRKK